jgi:hypothetical protein
MPTRICIDPNATLEALVQRGLRRMHAAPWRKALCPRGPLRKESLSGTILDHLQGAFEAYTDPEYSDNPEPQVLIGHIAAAAQEEFEAALGHPGVRLRAGVSAGRQVRQGDPEGPAQAVAPRLQPGGVCGGFPRARGRGAELHPAAAGLS